MSMYSEIVTERQESRPLPAGTATARTIFATEDGILFCYGTTKPTDATAGYAPGCIFIDTDASSSAFVYINEGSVTSCSFKYVAAGT
jgi:hypothetical protein